MRFILVVALIVAAPLGAQQPGVLRADIMVGITRVSGGFFYPRTGVTADLIVAGRLRRTRSGSIVGGLGLSGILGSTTDDCLFAPGKGCAEDPNFGVVSALVGVDHALARGSLRVLLGAAQFNGARDHSVGVHGRIGFATDPFVLLAFGLMAHATLLPNHDGATLVVWGAGFGLTLR